MKVVIPVAILLLAALPFGLMALRMAWDLEGHPSGIRVVVFSSGRVEEMDAKPFQGHFRK